MKKILLYVFCSVFFSLMAQTVTNGSITGAPCANSGINGGNAAGWSGCGFSPDLCCLAMPSYVSTSQVTPALSPDGGTWLGIAALGECAQTTITGLTVGTNYTLYFCGACFGTGTGIYNSAPATPRITVGAAVQTFNIPMTASTWYGYNMVFTANATSMVLRAEHLNGSNAYASLDGFRINAVCSVTLPLEVTAFEAKTDAQTVALHWKTNNEPNHDYFIIERSLTGENWEEVTRVEPNLNHDYQIVDNQPYVGQSYYRLVAVSKDGIVSYHKIEQVEMNPDTYSLVIFPNPTQSDLYVQYGLPLSTQQISCYNSIGQQIPIEITQEGSRYVLHTQHLPDGVYFLRVQTPEKQEVRKIIIQH